MLAIEDFDAEENPLVFVRDGVSIGVINIKVGEGFLLVQNSKYGGGLPGSKMHVREGDERSIELIAIECREYECDSILCSWKITYELLLALQLKIKLES